MRSPWIKPAARWIAVLVSLVSFGFAALSYTGFWSEFRGNNQAANAANRFDLSYGPEAALPVTSDDPAWKPLLRIIEKYTQARLLQDRAPRLLVRSVAVSSEKLMADDVIIAQWTAPTTPVVLFYTHWPDPGHGPFIKDKDFVTVGSLGDLHDWIRRDQADFDFLWRTLIFGALSLCIATFLALPDTQPPTAKSQVPSRILADTDAAREAELEARGPDAIRELLKSSGAGQGATVKGTNVPRLHAEQWLARKDAEHQERQEWRDWWARGVAIAALIVSLLAWLFPHK